MDILDTTSHANAIITDLVKIAEKKGAAEGSTPKTIAAGINLITNTLSGNEEAKSPVIVRALDELVDAVGSGGGGSSDFSIANVTFICNASETITVEIAVVEEANPPFEPTPKTWGYYVLENGDEVTVKAVLYKGTCDCFIRNGSMSGSGDVVVGLNEATITGDCTITIS